MKTRANLATLLGLILLTHAVPAQDTSGRVLFTDSLKGKLAEGWSWTRPAENTWTNSDDGLRIKTLPGTLWLASNNAKNLLLRPLPATNNFSCCVTVTSAPERNGEQAGLLLYVDDDNYIKVVREFFQGKLQLIFAREEDGKGQGIHYLPENQNPVVLRLVAKGSSITATYRNPEDKDWIDLGTCPALKKLPQAGFFTHGGDPQADRQVQFNSFEIRTE